MKEDIAIRIAAWFDEELTGAEKAEIEALLESDEEAQAYLKELKRTRSALQGAHVSPVEDSAAWGALQDRLEKPSTSNTGNLLQFPRMAAAAAAIVALGMGLWWPLRQTGHTAPETGLESSVYMVETEIENATPIVYIDETSGWTVVWVLEDEIPEEQG
jgi:anti-sigma factor RsiW